MGWGDRWPDRWDYEPSRPRNAKGGIKSQSKRGTFGTSWWATQWIEVLESFDIGARLQRGRTYARKGQVLSIDIGKGCVKAKVQGSRRRPYDVKIIVATLNDAQWSQVTDALSEQAIFAAKLLSGEMPEDIEQVFKDIKLSLLPGRRTDIDTDCSCPDWSNPCKHVAAVYYLIGEEFDRDPFLIFKLRGMDREQLIERLHGSIGEPAEEEPSLSEPLQTNARDFWAGGSLPDGLLGDIRVPPVSAALPKRLGNLPFWHGEQPLINTVESVYEQASAAGMEIVVGRQNTDKLAG